MKNLFDLTGKTALITGAGGLLGPKHAEAIIESGGRVILTDHHEDRVQEKAKAFNNSLPLLMTYRNLHRSMTRFVNTIKFDWKFVFSIP